MRITPGGENAYTAARAGLLLVPRGRGRYNPFSTEGSPETESGPPLSDTLPTTGQPPSDAGARLQRAEQIIGALDKGLAVLSADLVVRWANDPFREWCAGDPVGRSFFDALQTPAADRPGDHAFHAALAGSSSCFRLAHNNRYLDVTVSPIRDRGRVIELVAMADDVTAAVNRQQKLNALYKAGQELDALEPEQLAEMNVMCRVELLKANLRQYVHNLLRYTVIEVRRFEPKTNRLLPLLEEGMTPEASGRGLEALETGNGVTGYVAATKKPYLCADTANDPHYIEGSEGAKSSMTVPLMFNDELVGTFNVESTEVNAFGAEDLQFTEMFARELARALHTLNLLDAQEACAAAGIVQQVHRDIALPSDDLLSVTSTLLERTVGQPEYAELLLRIVADLRKIKMAVHRIFGEVARQNAVPMNPKLAGMRVLVVDADERIRRTAHTMLERQGCLVDAAASAADGIAMAKACTYDAVLVAIKHADMGGTAAYRALVKAVPLGRVILMQGFEYDGAHTVVNVKQDGYWLPILYKKPLQEGQLFDALTCPTPAAHPATPAEPHAVAS